jgi:U3 small nucleolar RNA-associated protein 4
LINAPFLERTIPGKWENTVEVICWAGSRLFSVGMSGDGLKEWDLKTLTPKRRLLLTGEKGICMDYHKETEMLAVGTEEGIVNIFDVSDDDLQFVRLLDRQDHRIICCKFNQAGDKLVSGSLDAVKVWNVQTGHAIHKMSTGRADPTKETIVWCIDILKSEDFTIITGDSRGKVTFWDGNLGSQIDYVHASTVDIMCLSVADDQKSFFCSGTEQILKKYAKVSINRGGNSVDQWIRCAKKSKIHTHDVLAMTTIGNEKLISGGIDGFLSFASQDFKTFERAGPFLKRPFAEVAEESRLLLLKYVNYLEVWKLASGNELAYETKETTEKLFDDDEDEIEQSQPTPVETKQLYRISEFPEKFLEMRSKGDEMILCCAISNDGKWIAYSTMSSIRLFRFEIQAKAKPQLKVVKHMPDDFTPCINMTFLKDSNMLITVKSDGTSSVFQIDGEVVEHKETFDFSDFHSDLVHQIAISSCSKFLILASLCNNVTVWNLKQGKWNHVKTLPKYSYPVTSMNIRQDQPILAVFFSDNRLLEFNLDNLVIQFSAMLPHNSLDSVITNVCTDPRNPDAIIFGRNNEIQVLLKHSEASGSSKKAKKTQNTEIVHSIKTVKKFNTVRNENIHLNLMKLIKIFFSSI